MSLCSAYLLSLFSGPSSLCLSPDQSLGRVFPIKKSCVLGLASKSKDKRKAKHPQNCQFLSHQLHAAPAAFPVQPFCGCGLMSRFPCQQHPCGFSFPQLDVTPLTEECGFGTTQLSTHPLGLLAGCPSQAQILFLLFSRCPLPFLAVNCLLSCVYRNQLILNWFFFF